MRAKRRGLGGRLHARALTDLRAHLPIDAHAQFAWLHTPTKNPSSARSPVQDRKTAHGYITGQSANKAGKVAFDRESRDNVCLFSCRGSCRSTPPRAPLPAESGSAG